MRGLGHLLGSGSLLLVLALAAAARRKTNIWPEFPKDFDLGVSSTQKPSPNGADRPPGSLFKDLDWLFVRDESGNKFNCLSVKDRTRPQCRALIEKKFRESTAEPEPEASSAQDEEREDESSSGELDERELSGTQSSKRPYERELTPKEVCAYHFEKSRCIEAVIENRKKKKEKERKAGGEPDLPDLLPSDLAEPEPKEAGSAGEDDDW